MAYDQNDDTPVSQLNATDKLLCFKEWYKADSENDAAQRDREKDDLNYQIPENQWSTEAKEERRGRPMLSISLTAQPIQLIKNQAAAAHLGVDLEPVSEKASKELAEVKQGLFQRIQRDGLADQAREWAFDRAVQCGRGWYRITTQWDEDGDHPSDQEIVYERILYQDMVRPDCAAQKPDYSDARRMFVGGYMSGQAVKRMWPNATNWSAKDFALMARSEPDWVSDEGALVLECFYKEITYSPTKSGKRLREVIEVRRAVLTGCEVLEDEPYIINLIPIVPVFGRELQPIEGERRWEGMVRPARQGQETANYALSQAVEDVCSISKAPYVVAKGQLEGFEKQWQEANRKNWPYLTYNQVDADGKPAPPPQRMQVDGTKMQIALSLFSQAKELVQIGTHIQDPGLGFMPQKRDAASGRAILALQQQGDAGTSHYLENLKKYTLPYDARVVLAMMPVVYDRPGRITQILGREDQSKPVMLNQHFVMVDGRPTPVAPEAQGAQLYDLSAGKYSIVPIIGKSHQTRLQEGQDFLGEVINADPTIMGVAGDLVFQFRSEPGAKEIAERLKRKIQMTMPGIMDDGGTDLEQAKTENSALKSQLQQLTQQMQQAMQALQTDQAKHQASIQIAQFKTQADAQMEDGRQKSQVLIAQMNNAAKIEVARIQAAKDAMNKDAEIKEELLSTGLKVQAEAEANAIDRAHETRMQHQDHAHEVGTMAMAHAHAKESAAMAGAKDQASQAADHAHEGDMAQKAADQAAADQAAQAQADGAGV